MMAYDSGHVVSVLINGQVKREQNEASERTVRIPFDSEYALRIKNKTNLRSLVKVLIDGTVCAERLLLRPGQSLDLERFVIDGDLTKGNRFKFVRLNNPNVQDPTAGENGLIEVIVEPEMAYAVTTSWNPPPNWTIWNYINNSGHGNIGTSNPSFHSGQSQVYGAANSLPPTSTFMNVSTNCGPTLSSAGSTFTSTSAHIPQVEKSLDQGATVEGSVSHQKFVESNEWFHTATAIKIPIRIKGPKVIEKHWVLDTRNHSFYRTEQAGKYSAFTFEGSDLVIRIPMENVTINS